VAISEPWSMPGFGEAWLLPCLITVSVRIAHTAVFEAEQEQ
jgi:hypothetical protein